MKNNLLPAAPVTRRVWVFVRSIAASGLSAVPPLQLGVHRICSGGDMDMSKVVTLIVGPRPERIIAVDKVCIFFGKRYLM